MPKQLVVNADDFGFTKDVNDGILASHLGGILTAATLMANGRAFDHAVQLAQQHPSLDIGCHLVLVQGNSLIDGRPYPATPQALVRAVILKKVNILAELRAQVERIIAAGIEPTHLDTHKHTHVLPSIFDAVVRVAAEFDIPFIRLPFDATKLGTRTLMNAFQRSRRAKLRRFGLRAADHFTGFWLTGYLTEVTLATTLRSLPEGSTELMCHPGYLSDELSNAATRLKNSRVRELEALTSPEIKETLRSAGVRLCSYRDLVEA